MSFKFKDKIINIAVRSIIVILLIMTLCILVIYDRYDGADKYNKTFESVLLIATGYMFGRGESDDDNKKGSS